MTQDPIPLTDAEVESIRAENIPGDVRLLATIDCLKSAIEDLSNWYQERDACSPGSVVSALGVANDLQSLLHEPDTFQCGVNDVNE